MTQTAPPRLGILMLDTAFPRPVGDIGHPDSFGFPVRYARVRGASARAAVQGDPGALLAPFVAEGRKLVAAGCTGLGTSCGFLAPLQSELARALGVPVAASALSMVPMVAGMLPKGQNVAILSISANHLGATHLRAAGITGTPVIAGCDPHSTFVTTILENRADWHAPDAENDVRKAALQLIERHPDTGGIVLECTNMGPYADAIRADTGRVVWSVIDLLSWFHAGLPAAR